MVFAKSSYSEMCLHRLPDGSLMEVTKVYPLDAVYDCPEDVPEDVTNSPC